MSRFKLKDTLNTRDLGGYYLEGGELTISNVFVRSDAPLNLSEEDVKSLIENNIRTIIDLRSDEETKRKPYALMNNKDFKYYHRQIFGGGTIPKSGEFVPISYFEMVDEKKSIFNVMKILANVEGGALYHCAVGKDRTGVISALLLLIVGTKREDVLSDYEASWDNLKDELIEYCKSNERVNLDIVTPKREYMEKFLDMFHEKYNSIEEYLLQIGLNNDEITKLRGKLVKGIK
ncbi:tyrosine-protein phosphatase [Clostridium gasigenes]|uniref:tyrosine-protein phosphatase n=1 Tax=Clostridium gasigenes TaxID=94869 RepID=UPI001C0DC693|nr:tyrosine-protein phosphatase [Clostridium gasigenes]MBU3137404.1 tyrosine-protein phosphatase [Clostridium gasigenes]